MQPGARPIPVPTLVPRIAAFVPMVRAQGLDPTAAEVQGAEVQGVEVQGVEVQGMMGHRAARMVPVPISCRCPTY